MFDFLKKDTAAEEAASQQLSKTNSVIAAIKSGVAWIEFDPDGT